MPHLVDSKPQIPPEKRTYDVESHDNHPNTAMVDHDEL